MSGGQATLLIAAAFVAYTSLGSAVAGSVPEFKAPELTERTSLSRDASSIGSGDRLETVWTVLGVPTFVLLKRDSRDWPLEVGIYGRLFYENGQCAPIVVDLSDELKVMGLDEGRSVCTSSGELYPSELMPPAKFSCALRQVDLCGLSSEND